MHILYMLQRAPHDIDDPAQPEAPKQGIIADADLTRRVSMHEERDITGHRRPPGAMLRGPRVLYLLKDSPWSACGPPQPRTGNRQGLRPICLGRAGCLNNLWLRQLAQSGFSGSAKQSLGRVATELEGLEQAMHPGIDVPGAAQLFAQVLPFELLLTNLGKTVGLLDAEQRARPQGFGNSASLPLPQRPLRPRMSIFRSVRWHYAGFALPLAHSIYDLRTFLLSRSRSL